MPSVSCAIAHDLVHYSLSSGSDVGGMILHRAGWGPRWAERGGNTRKGGEHVEANITRSSALDHTLCTYPLSLQEMGAAETSPCRASQRQYVGEAS